MNSGDPNGVAQLVENWHEASRQHAAICYDLKGIHVMTNTVVERVLLQGNRTTGVALTDGQRLMASKEVILSCGALRTPQLLMLSGIDPSPSFPSIISSSSPNCLLASTCTITAL